MICELAQVAIMNTTMHIMANTRNDEHPNETYKSAIELGA